jgi:hypothetical protein
VGAEVARVVADGIDEARFPAPRGEKPKSFTQPLLVDGTRYESRTA